MLIVFLLTANGHSDSVYSISWSPDTRLASASADGTVGVWDVKSGRHELAIYQIPGTQRIPAVYAVAWSPDGEKIASADDTGIVRVWQAR